MQLGYQTPVSLAHISSLHNLKTLHIDLNDWSEASLDSLSITGLTSLTLKGGNIHPDESLSRIIVANSQTLETLILEFYVEDFDDLGT